MFQQRNKPIQPPKVPKAAPFFLPTIPGLQPKFAPIEEDKPVDKVIFCYYFHQNNSMYMTHFLDFAHVELSWKKTHILVTKKMQLYSNFIINLAMETLSRKTTTTKFGSSFRKFSAVSPWSKPSMVSCC